MDNLPTAGRLGWLDKYFNHFRLQKKYECIDLKEELLLVNREISVPYKGFPIAITLGRNGRMLHLYPELPINASPNAVPCGFILFDPEQYTKEIGGFLRLRQGDKVLLGREVDDQTCFFRYPNKVNKRHLMVLFTGDSLVFKDLHTDYGTRIAPLKTSLDISILSARRLERLRRIRALYGVPMAPLSPLAALDALQKVNKLLANDKHRPMDRLGRPGGVVLLPEQITPIIIGDMHARIDNLLKILSENNVLESLERQEAALIILGDAVHSEEDGELERMEGSAFIMDLIFRLKIRFPNNLFYLRGNHDCFSPDVGKGGVPQGLFWERYLRMERGEEYVREMVHFYEQSPCVALSRDFLTCHAAPPRAKATLDLLINLRQYPGLAKELIWNRLRSPIRPSGYVRGDVNRFRSSLELPPETPFIVSHTPIARESPNQSVWLNVGNIPNHHIVFSGLSHCIGLFTRINGRIVHLHFPTEPLIKIINSLGPNEESMVCDRAPATP